MKFSKEIQAELHDELISSTDSLVRLANECCWNQIATESISYIITFINPEAPAKKRFRMILERNLVMLRKKRSLNEVVSCLAKMLNDLYLVEILFLKSKSNRTIIEISVLRKSMLSFQYQKKVKNDFPSFHPKLAIPPYRDNMKREKFDVNWQLGTYEFWFYFFKRS